MSFQTQPDVFDVIGQKPSYSNRFEPLPGGKTPQKFSDAARSWGFPP
ncbi:MAG: hypothetical protein F6K55_17415 [Moorea sp. SIO4A3]|nr:hypothetical protein [Moorena sp. SIO4A3]